MKKQRIFQHKILVGDFGRQRGAEMLCGARWSGDQEGSNRNTYESRGCGPRDKESNWWNESVKVTFRLKGNALKYDLCVKMHKTEKKY